MTPSKYQSAIYDWVGNGQGSAVIEAVAGSGKTSTILEVLKLIPCTSAVLMLAFNKSIADELKSRVPPHVVVKTFNGLGHSILSKRLGKLELSSWKMRDIVRASMEKEEFTEFGTEVIALANFARRVGLSASPDETKWEDVLHHFGITIELDIREEAINYARAALNRSVEMAIHEKIVDFDDQIYIPSMRKGFAADTYDWVFVDEAQDASKTRIKLAKLSLNPGGRVVACGDSSQAIYGFTGADSDAMNSFSEVFNACKFPLSISYRCAKSIVRAAQKVMPAIEFSDTAKEGAVEYYGLDWKLGIFTIGDMVVSRRNAPLMSLAWKLVGSGVGCRILGRDISSGLTSLIKKLRAKSLPELGGKLRKWLADEKANLDPEKDAVLIDQLTDKANCITTLLQTQSVDTVQGLIGVIEGMFSDDTSDASSTITLCSVHKSKGLEADRVFILNPQDMPLASAKLPWQVEQEYNLLYVAITRAKSILTFIEME
jgi:DNA helicase-2/ATP-dependent DNA helicase PcrA